MNFLPVKPWIPAFAGLTALFIAGCASEPTAPPTLGPDQIAAIVASPERSPADRANDQRRLPREMLAFIGLRPGMVAMDVSAARGYTTELVARAVGPTGKVYAQNAPRDPNRAPPPQPEGAAAPPPANAPAPLPTLAERTRNPALSHIVVVARPFEDPAPPEVANGALDVVTLLFNYHDFGHLGVDRTKANAAIYKALRKGGTYVIADHAGRDGTGIGESGSLHRVEEAFVIREVEAAGFKLHSRGDFLRNYNDPRDKNTPNPPMPKDEFVLKFVKP